jgi:hypothetical protein
LEPVKACHDKVLEISANDPSWCVAQRCALGETEGETEILISAGNTCRYGVSTGCLSRSSPVSG